MRKTRWMVFLTIVMSVSATSFADETSSYSADGDIKLDKSVSVEALFRETKYAVQWQQIHPVHPDAYLDNWPRPIADFNFQHANAFARVSELQGLSLLTLAEFGQTRLFLGVNADGLVGLHVSAFPRYSDQHYLEISRMPYLKHGVSDRETE